MKNERPKSTIDAAASRLRAMVRSADEGTLLGSEEELTGMLGVSRSTIRQIARLLEREGLLRVKRGINGGYFAVRPDVATIATTVSTYLEIMDTEHEDLTEIASVLWVQVVRKAAAVKTREAKSLAETFRKKVSALPADATFDDVLHVEQECQSAVFQLINSRYIELIFRINVTFAGSRFHSPAARDNTSKHRDFVQAWRKTKLLELEAIADGDQAVGMMAARHARNLWHQRLWGHSDTVEW